MKKKKKRCHTSMEILPNLFIGGMENLPSMALQMDILIPLDSLPGSIWEWGFRGEILYIPIQDYGVLPVNIEKEFVDKICKLLKNKKIFMFCWGGHGRTGYMTSLILYKLKKLKDPIAFLRKNYCKKAIESNEQVAAIAEYCRNPELMKYEVLENYTSLISKYMSQHDL